MIDPLTEEIIWPRDVVKMLPKGSNGKHLHIGYVYRAMKTGCRGVVLESIRTPRLATSKPAVARYLRALSDADRPAGTAPRRSGARERGNQEVERELDQLGI